ncbi:hypothetical protein C8Q80DRAFT_308719 [Daedaleopsis nitida]|nr:hypothetical protein C8Q80DRAFT_308719 [Daedaleopsis nitida]
MTAQAYGIDMMSIDSLYLLWVTKCCTVVALTFLSLETLSTLPSEIALIWPSRFTYMKLLYFLNKYTVFADVVLLILFSLKTRDSETCKKQYLTLACKYHHRSSSLTLTPPLTVLHTTGILVSEVILMVRFMAIWGFNKYVVALSISAYGMLCPFALYAVYETVIYAGYPSGYLLMIAGCPVYEDDQDTWPAYMLLILAESVIISLTFVKRQLDREYQGMLETSLFRIMYRDGIFYYVAILLFTITNIVVLLAAPRELSTCMQMFGSQCLMTVAHNSDLHFI